VLALEADVEELKTELRRWRLRRGLLGRLRQSSRAAAAASLATSGSNTAPLSLAVRTVPLLQNVEGSLQLWRLQRRTITAVTALDYVQRLRRELAAEDGSDSDDADRRRVLVRRVLTNALQAAR